MHFRIRILHSVLFWTSISILTASLIFWLLKWNSLPEEIGMHFAPDGQFDVIASKFYGFYPHIVSGILTAGLQTANILTQKKQIGFSLTPEGETLFRTELCLTLDVLTVLINFFFANWSRAVSLQTPLDAQLAGNLFRIMLLVSLTGMISQVITCRKHRSEKPAISGMAHRLCRLTAWLLTAGNFLILAELWERYPLDETLYTNPDYYGLVYFANPDIYLDRHFLLILPVLTVILLIVLEFLSRKPARSALTDSLKLYSGIFFFWWNLLLCLQCPVGFISAGLYLVLCTFSFISYFRKNHRKETICQ